jgi:hypothetical protein
MLYFKQLVSLTPAQTALGSRYPPGAGYRSGPISQTRSGYFNNKISGPSSYRFDHTLLHAQSKLGYSLDALSPSPYTPSTPTVAQRKANFTEKEVVSSRINIKPAQFVVSSSSRGNKEDAALGLASHPLPSPFPRRRRRP